MNEKEKNIVMQELWALVAQDACATKHCFEIMQKMTKCAFKEDLGQMTPNKRKVIEELQLQWRFVKTIHEDLVKIAAKFGQTAMVPAVPELVINDDLWDVKNSGASAMIYDTNDKIADYQEALQHCVFKLQEMCA